MRNITWNHHCVLPCHTLAETAKAKINIFFPKLVVSGICYRRASHLTPATTQSVARPPESEAFRESTILEQIINPPSPSPNAMIDTRWGWVEAILLAFEMKWCFCDLLVLRAFPSVGPFSISPSSPLGSKPNYLQTSYSESDHYHRPSIIVNVNVET